MGPHLSIPCISAVRATESFEMRITPTRAFLTLWKCVHQIAVLLAGAALGQHRGDRLPQDQQVQRE